MRRRADHRSRCREGRIGEVGPRTGRSSARRAKQLPTSQRTHCPFRTTSSRLLAVRLSKGTSAPDIGVETPASAGRAAARTTPIMAPGSDDLGKGGRGLDGDAQSVVKIVPKREQFRGEFAGVRLPLPLRVVRFGQTAAPPWRCKSVASEDSVALARRPQQAPASPHGRRQRCFPIWMRKGRRRPKRGLWPPPYSGGPIVWLRAGRGTAPLLSCEIPRRGCGLPVRADGQYGLPSTGVLALATVRRQPDGRYASMQTVPATYRWE